MNSKDRLIELQAIQELTGVSISCYTCERYYTGRFGKYCELGKHRDFSRFPPPPIAGFCLEWRHHNVNEQTKKS